MNTATDPKHFMNTQTTYQTQKPIGAEIEGNKPFYMVIRLGSNGSQQGDSTPTMRYDDGQEAWNEAFRLAQKHPNHSRGFAVVKAFAIVRGSVSTEYMVLDGEKLTEESNA